MDAPVHLPSRSQRSSSSECRQQRQLLLVHGHDRGLRCHYAALQQSETWMLWACVCACYDSYSVGTLAIPIERGTGYEPKAQRDVTSGNLQCSITSGRCMFILCVVAFGRQHVEDVTDCTISVFDSKEQSVQHCIDGAKLQGRRGGSQTSALQRFAG